MSLIKKMALGTVQFGMDYGISNTKGQIKYDEVAQILATAHELGIDVLDTARAYGNSESLLGDFGVSDFKLVSKFNSVHTDSALTEQLSETLANLQVDALYGYMSHDAEFLLLNPWVMEQLAELKACSQIEKIGCSCYSPDQAERLMKLPIPPDLLQVPYNPIDTRFELCFENLKSHDVEIHVRSAFLQGLFFMPVDGLSDFFDPVKALLKDWRSVWPENDRMASALLRFVAGNPHVDKVIFGVNSVQQLISNCSLIDQTDQEITSVNGDIPEEIYLPYLWPTTR